MPWHVSSRKNCRRPFTSNSSSTTGPAPAAPSARARSRRPHPTATRCCSATPARSRSIPVSTPCRHRSAQAIRADRTGRLDAGGAACQSVVSCQDRGRRDRARQEGSGQTQSRLLGRRHRRLHVRRAVQGGRRRRRCHHSLQGHGAGHERSARRPCADGFRRVAAGAGQYPGRQTSRHRRHQQEALLAIAGCADVR